MEFDLYFSGWIVLFCSSGFHRRAFNKANWVFSNSCATPCGCSVSEWCGGRQVVPIIQSMQDNANEIVQTEVERTLRRIGPVSMDQQAAIEYMGKAIANKMLHKPFCYLKNQPEVIQNEVSREIINALFSLEILGADPLSGDDT